MLKKLKMSKTKNATDNGQEATEEKASRWTAKSLIGLGTSQGKFGYFVKLLSVALRNNRGADGKAVDKKGKPVKFDMESTEYKSITRKSSDTIKGIMLADADAYKDWSDRMKAAAEDTYFKDGGNRVGKATKVVSELFNDLHEAFKTSDSVDYAPESLDDLNLWETEETEEAEA